MTVQTMSDAKKPNVQVAQPRRLIKLLISAMGRLTPKETYEWRGLLGLPHFEFLDWPSRLVLAGKPVAATFASPHDDPELLRQLIRRPCWSNMSDSFEMLVAANPATPDPISARIAKSDFNQVDGPIARAVHCGSIYQSLVRHYSRKQVRELLATGSKWDRRKLTESPDCPPSNLPALLVELDHDRFMSIDATVPWLEKMAVHSDIEIRAGVARHPNCPQTLRRRILDDLVETATSDELPYRAGVLAASNPYCTTHDLETLGALPCWEIMAAVAANPACPESLRKSLEENIPLALKKSEDELLDEEGNVFSLLWQPLVNFPKTVLAHLVTKGWLNALLDPVEYSMHEIIHHPSWPWDDDDVIGHEIFHEYLQRWGDKGIFDDDSYLGERFLEPLVKSIINDSRNQDSPWWMAPVILLKMARSPYISSRWLKAIATYRNSYDDNPDVVLNLAIAVAINHPKFKKGDLDALSDGESICLRPRESDYWKSELSKVGQGEREAIERASPLWIKDSRRRIQNPECLPDACKLLVLACGNVSQEAMIAAASSDEWEERAAVALNPRIGDESLLPLLSDANREVAKCARRASAIRRTNSFSASR